MQQLIQQIYTQAQLLGACDLFKGTEDTERLVRLFLTPQGQEFCTKHAFPSLSTFRQIKKQAGVDLKKYGIYIDEGTTSLKNPTKGCVFIGKTTATLVCDNCQRYSVTTMHGARAIVNAMKWAVVAIEAERKDNIIVNRSDNAIILW